MALSIARPEATRTIPKQEKACAANGIFASATMFMVLKITQDSSEGVFEKNLFLGALKSYHIIYENKTHPVYFIVRHLFELRFQ
jgi:hypothetical protein